MLLKQYLSICASILLLSSVVFFAGQTQTVSLVLVSAEVRDGRDRVVTGLTKENFKLSEDGVEQTIAAFRERGNEYEISYTSTNTAKDGKWRAIRVNVVGLPVAVQVRAKQGYYSEKSQ